MKRREFLESGAVGFGGFAVASAIVASASAEPAGASTQTKVASAPAGMGSIDADHRHRHDQGMGPRQGRGLPEGEHESLDKRGSRHQQYHRADLRGLNAACTNLQPEPTRRHIRAALQAGATRNEIQLVIEGAAFMAIHACSLGAPILLEEGKAAGKVPTVKKAATPSADMMKAKGLWNTALDSVLRSGPSVGRSVLCGRRGHLRRQDSFAEVRRIAQHRARRVGHAHVRARHAAPYQGRLGPGCDHGRDHGDAEDRHFLWAGDDQHCDTDPGRGNCCIREEEIVRSLERVSPSSRSSGRSRSSSESALVLTFP